MTEITIITHGGETFVTEVEVFDAKAVAELTNEHKMIAIGDVVLHSTTIAKVLPSSNIQG